MHEILSANWLWFLICSEGACPQHLPYSDIPSAYICLTLSFLSSLTAMRIVLSVYISMQYRPVESLNLSDRKGVETLLSSDREIES